MRARPSRLSARQAKDGKRPRLKTWATATLNNKLWRLSVREVLLEGLPIVGLPSFGGSLEAIRTFDLVYIFVAERVVTR